MGKNEKISEYRERLDRTLASPELTNEDSLRTLVKNQLLRSSLDEDEGCSENVIQRKTNEVSYFLQMLRSTSDHETLQNGQTSHGEWKLKDDNEEYRVMYRPGPHGTPLHTLLVEGYVDGPLDTCLCVSWESTLYKKWWPQSSFPPFRITYCECLQKVRISEHLTLLRVKVTWPLSAREAVVHFFLLEHLKEGLLVVLVNSISDAENIDKSTHGFTRDGIPEVKDVVRIDIVGGFAIQKVTPERSYFRTIATVDLKLDFVPPSLLNFISRQLVGSGFKLFQKAVASVSNNDEDYSKALEDPLYARIHEALLSTVEPNDTPERKDLKTDSCLPLQGNSTEEMHNNSADNNASESMVGNEQVADKKSFGEIEEGETHESEESRQSKDEIKSVEHNDVHSNGAIETSYDTVPATYRKIISEIEEEESDFSIDFKNDISEPSNYIAATRSPLNHKTNIAVSPEVERALYTLEKAITLVRERGNNSVVKFSSVSVSKETPIQQKITETSSIFAKDVVSSDTEVPVEVSQKGRIVDRTSHESKTSSSNCDIRRTGSNSFAREVNHNKIAPASPSPEQVTALSNTPLKLSDDKLMLTEVDGINSKKPSRKKNHMFCCFDMSRR
ncbi:uncharacterized protein LOC126677883 [Mercurialis annua]|uniref:uncharacterized protein LOC126677883 n=1 Tax=Mercurialis annua TaxID=3986 RepID=UPI0021609784|nr:uncharacterized protein LOC126677883 [Mercurialis annua]